MPLLPTLWVILGTMLPGTSLCGVERKTTNTLWTTITPVLDLKVLNKPIAVVNTPTECHTTLPCKSVAQTEPPHPSELVKNKSRSQYLFRKSRRINKEKMLDFRLL